MAKRGGETGGLRQGFTACDDDDGDGDNDGLLLARWTGHSLVDNMPRARQQTRFLLLYFFF